MSDHSEQDNGEKPRQHTHRFPSDGMGSCLDCHPRPEPSAVPLHEHYFRDGVCSCGERGGLVFVPSERGPTDGTTQRIQNIAKIANELVVGNHDLRAKVELLQVKVDRLEAALLRLGVEAAPLAPTPIYKCVNCGQTGIDGVCSACGWSRPRAGSPPCARCGGAGRVEDEDWHPHNGAMSYFPCPVCRA